MKALLTVGIIAKYDRFRGWGEVLLKDGRSAEFHIGVFFSGRACRPPQQGDNVRVNIQQRTDSLNIVSAQLVV